MVFGRKAIRAFLRRHLWRGKAENVRADMEKERGQGERGTKYKNVFDSNEPFRGFEDFTAEEEIFNRKARDYLEGRYFAGAVPVTDKNLADKLETVYHAGLGSSRAEWKRFPGDSRVYYSNLNQAFRDMVVAFDSRQRIRGVYRKEGSTWFDITISYWENKR